MSGGASAPALSGGGGGMEMVAVASAARAAEVAAQAAHDLQDRMLQDARSAELRVPYLGRRCPIGVLARHGPLDYW